MSFQTGASQNQKIESTTEITGTKSLQASRE
jgi:hypothetical protein